MKPALTLLTLVACADKGPVREPAPCTAAWNAAPCSAEYIDLHWCDPCGEAWTCVTTDDESVPSAWEPADLDCSCSETPGQLDEACGG